MPRYIMKLEKGNRSYYMEWSTIVDAPVTRGMPLGQFAEYYRERYGSYGSRNLQSRIDRANRYGCSSVFDSRESLIEANHAGDGGKKLTKEQIIEQFIDD